MLVRPMTARGRSVFMAGATVEAELCVYVCICICVCVRPCMFCVVSYSVVEACITLVGSKPKIRITLVESKPKICIPLVESKPKIRIPLVESKPKIPT